MKKIIDWFSGGVVKEIGGVLDKLFTSDEERDKAKNEIFKVLKQQEIELHKLQNETILAEANGNWLQRSTLVCFIRVLFTFVNLHNKII